MLASGQYLLELWVKEGALTVGAPPVAAVQHGLQLVVRSGLEHFFKEFKNKL